VTSGALHLSELAALFAQVVKLARECGLVKLGTIAVDGTKLRANASKHKAMSYARMQAAEAQLQQEVEALLARAAQADAAEANEPETDLPAEIARREQRLAAIRAASNGSRRASARPMPNVADAPTTTINRRRVATDRRSAGAVLAGPSASPTPRRRTTSPIPTAAS